MCLTLQTPITSKNLLQVQLFCRRNDHIPVTNRRSKKALIFCDMLGGGFPGYRISSKSSYLTHGLVYLLQTGPGKDQHFAPAARGLKVPAICRYRWYNRNIIIQQPQVFSSGLLSIHSLPSLGLCLALPRPMGRALHLALLNIVRL